MKLVLCFASIVLIATVAEGLLCLTCQNARTIAQCQRQGRVRLCGRNQKSCQTQIRSDPQGIRITKECKQRNACMNNKAQNRRPAWNPTQCSTGQGSVCTCCCFEDNCNFNSLFCPTRPTTTTRRPIASTTTMTTTTVLSTTTLPSSPVPPTTTALQPPPVPSTAALSEGNEALREDEGFSQGCPPLTLSNGEIACSHENRNNSICHFECFEFDGYSPFPRSLTETRCNGTAWSQPLPCCTRDCPPFSKTDLVVLLGITTPTNWSTATIFVDNLVGKFVVSDDSLRVAVVRYTNDIDVSSEILLNSYSSYSDQLSNAILDIGYGTNGSTIGKALRYVNETVLALVNGNRPDAQDVVLLITDAASEDAFKSEAEGLKLRGTKIIVIAVDNSDLGEIALSTDELASIASSLMRVNNGTSGLTNDVANTVIAQSICTNPCLSDSANSK